MALNKAIRVAALCFVLILHVGLLTGQGGNTDSIRTDNDRKTHNGNNVHINAMKIDGNKDPDKPLQQDSSSNQDETSDQNQPQSPPQPPPSTPLKPPTSTSPHPDTNLGTRQSPLNHNSAHDHNPEDTGVNAHSPSNKDSTEHHQDNSSPTNSMAQDNPKPSAGQEGGEPIQGECSADDQHCTQTKPCTYTSEQGVQYSIDDFASKSFLASLPNKASLRFQLCSNEATMSLCNNKKSPTCLFHPGVPPVSTGISPRIEQIEPFAPGRGFKMIFEGGEVCAITRQARRTVILFPCNPNARYLVNQISPRRTYEGEKKDNLICNYFVEFADTNFGCPVGSLREEQGRSLLLDDGSQGSESHLEVHIPEIWSVSGCSDSKPIRTTENCRYSGDVVLSIHGLFFEYLCNAGAQNVARNSKFTFNHLQCTNFLNHNYEMFIGSKKCKKLIIWSPYQINCTVEGVFGKGLGVSIKLKHGRNDVIASLGGAVSFKEPINFRNKFGKFVELGVGGLKDEIDELYRRAFASRGTPPDLLEKLGISHIKGILLYGPPGTGKTLLARTIAKILGTDQVKLVNAPELISKFLGESEKNLRAVFKEAHDAWKERGALSDLYVIVIDEIDAICKPRGKSDQSSASVAYDALVNQLLTLMDGLNEVHNIIVIGMTNRRELLDPALLRPGRFEVQIEINLPDKKGRWEIFEIHTRLMRESNLLSADVDLWGLASNTTRFSGAEVAGVVRAAASYALERYQIYGGDVLVQAFDFQRAIHEIDPAYTHSEDHVVSKYLPFGYLPCGEGHDAIIDEALEVIHTLKQSSMTRMQSVLLYGPRGSGKTALAAHLSVMGKFPLVKILTASELVGRPDPVKVDILYQIFSEAFKSESAIIVLDDLHRLVEFTQVGSLIQISHHVLHTLTTLLTLTPPSTSKLLVIGTMTVPEGVASLEEPFALNLPELFTQHFNVPLLDSESVLGFISARNIYRVGGGQFSLPGNLAVSVQQLIHAVECACTESEVQCGSGAGQSSSMVRQDSLLDCIMAFVTRRNLDADGPGLFSA